MTQPPRCPQPARRRRGRVPLVLAATLTAAIPPSPAAGALAGPSPQRPPAVRPRRKVPVRGHRRRAERRQRPEHQQPQRQSAADQPGQRGTRLYREQISGSSLTNVQQFFVGTYGRLRTVEPAPDGGMWMATSDNGDKDSTPHNSDNQIFYVTVS